MGKLVTMNQMLADAEEGGYAVGAFNVNDLTGVQGVADADTPAVVEGYPARPRRGSDGTTSERTRHN